MHPFRTLRALLHHSYVLHYFIATLPTLLHIIHYYTYNIHTKAPCQTRPYHAHCIAFTFSTVHYLLTSIGIPQRGWIGPHSLSSLWHSLTLHTWDCCFVCRQATLLKRQSGKVMPSVTVQLLSALRKGPEHSGQRTQVAQLPQLHWASPTNDKQMPSRFRRLRQLMLK